MKDRLFRCRRLLSGALALLLMGGLMYSCSDDYDLPDKTPSWLGSSIYNYLKEQGNYTNTVKLIDDLNYAEVLAKTGSKTLFVANDDAFKQFYASNPWGVSSYEQLSQSQKKLLLYSSMLDNAYLLEMMPNLTSTTINTDGTYLVKNQCLRQPTSSSATDSIPFFSWDSPAIPTTANQGLHNTGSKPDVDYWARFRTPSIKPGIRLALDGTAPLMIHWIAGEMGEQKITDDDFAKIVGQTRTATDVHVFGSKVLKQDITCQNGYIDQLDRVLVTPANMAEEIRTNGRTNLFSHMLDRFSAPYYQSALTASYQLLNPASDSVFAKHYLSARSIGGAVLETDPRGNRVSYYLSYDPGWNTYFNSSHGVQVDMGAMFVPSDVAMQKYFLTGGGGEFLMNAYAVEKPVTAENLQKNLDQIPLEVIQALINNLMKASFIETVPSKYITIMNDARDPMFSNVADVNAYKNKIDTCLVANNGVVYVMNEVYTPARYASVSAPALVGDSLHIFNWAITADDKYITNPNSAPLNAFISAYLLAMSSNFSFFIPRDNSLKKYYDPVSMAHTQPQILEFSFDQRSTSTPVTAKARNYDASTGVVENTFKTATASVVNNRLKDMLDGHIVVHTENEANGVLSGNRYYITKGGSAIKVTNPSAGVNGFQVQGGWQIDYNDMCNVVEIFDKSEKTNGYGNGMTYIIDKPIEATTKSVYSIMNQNGDETSPYYQFFELCQVDPQILEDAGFVDDIVKQSDKEKALAKYYVFTATNPCIDQNVRFFNTYRYTVYIPKNESVTEAIGQGLPTWTSIAAYIKERKDYISAHENDGTIDPDAETLKYKTKAQAMITCLLNFVKYHFQDNSIFADNNAISATDYETACINNVTNRYITVSVQSSGNNTLTVTDQAGHTRSIVKDNGNFNLMARDLQFDKAGANATTIATSSFAVLHQIDGVLNFKALSNNRYDADWTTQGNAKAFIAKYRIRK